MSLQQRFYSYFKNPFGLGWKNDNHSRKTSLLQPLPPELWLMIIQDLDVITLKSLSLTSMSFRWIAQPLVFTRISATIPGRYADMVSRAFPLLHRQKVFNRIKFLSCDRVAPVVREVSLHAAFPSSAHCFDAKVANAFFSLIQRLMNLASLSYIHVDLTRERLSEIQSLTKLSSLTLTCCRVSTTVIPRLPLRHITLEGAEPSLLSIIHPDYVEELSLLFVKDVRSSLKPKETFRRLRVLNVSHSIMFEPFILHMLSLSPFLESLKISVACVCLSVPPPISSILSILKSYIGPSYCAPFFCQGGLLVEAELSQLDTPTFGNTDITHSLRVLNDMNDHMECLTIHVTYMTQALLATLSEFRSLKKLDIESILMNDDLPTWTTRRDFITSLTTCRLSSTIEHMSFSVSTLPEGDGSASEPTLVSSWLGQYSHLVTAFIGSPQCRYTLQMGEFRWDDLRTPLERFRL